MKGILKIIPGLVLVIVFLGWFIHADNERQNEIDRIGLEDLNLQLTGVVDTVIKGGNYHGYGIIRLKVISSNIQDYDPRSKQEFYFCVIKNGIAEIYEHTFVSKVDTVIVDTKNKMIYYMEDGKKEAGSIGINASEEYYDYIKRKTIFK